MLLGMMFFSCAEDVMFEDKRSGILFEGKKDTIPETFVWQKSSDLTKDVNLTVQVMGNIVDYDRPFGLEQIPEEGLTGDTLMAKPGDHYVPFDNEDFKKHLVIKAGKNKAIIPVTLKRHAVLTTKVHRLKLRLIAGEHFKFDIFEFTDEEIQEPREGFPAIKQLERNIVFNDIISKPKGWYQYPAGYLFGEYSTEKHRFMVDVLERKIDADFMTKMESDNNHEVGEYQYVIYLLNKALKEYNAAHPDNPYTFNFEKSR